MSHDHSHHHGHHHGAPNYNRTFAIAIALNLLFVAIEVVWGFLADSLALLADAGHNLSDVVGLILAWVGNILAKKPSTQSRTYGFRKAPVIASLASALLLLFALGAIFWEAIGRFSQPAAVEGMTVIVVAAIGFGINGLTALLFIKGQKHDINIRGAYLHMAADAGVSLGVVIAGIVILVTGWLWIDPATSILIVVVILASTWGLFKASFNYAMDAVPENIDIPEVEQFLKGLDKVVNIHDLHVWPLSTTENALTVHLVIEGNAIDNHFLSETQKQLHDEYNIEHATIQIEAVSQEMVCLSTNHH